MEFHLERELRLRAEPEHNSLYSWAINEIDAQGKAIGRDQIPWPWSLNFTATSCVLCDSMEIESNFETAETAPTPPEIIERQVIRIQLRPGSPRDDTDFFREPTFSMFGTDRAVNNFQLIIHPIADPEEQENCRSWGSVSYTAEDDDFRYAPTEDCIVFYLFVKLETFARYSAKISQGFVDEMNFRVGSVAGFYSEWSPSITTHAMKVLTRGSEQKVTFPPGIQIEPPRLGYVGEASLSINRRLEFSRWAPVPDAI